MVIINTKYGIYLPKNYHIDMIKNRVAIYMGIKKMDKREIIRLTEIDRHTLYSIYKYKTTSISFKILD